jgi:hypothetical protein
LHDKISSRQIFYSLHISLIKKYQFFLRFSIKLGKNKNEKI